MAGSRSRRLALGIAAGAWLVGVAGCNLLEEDRSLVMIDVTGGQELVEINATPQYSAVGTFDDGSQKILTGEVVWASSDAGVATVDAAGAAVAVGAGETVISATHRAVVGETSLLVNGPESDPQTSGNSTVVVGEAVISSLFGPVNFSVDIPSEALSIGIVVRGVPGTWTFLEHGGLLLGGNQNVTGPDGTTVPVSFNQIDSTGDGNETNYGGDLLNRGSVAMFFPNNGTDVTLEAGTYTFPIGSADMTTGDLLENSLTPVVFYKTAAPTGQTMRVNLFVLVGAAPGVTTLAQAQADPEIQGAIAVLRNVYEEQAGLNLEINLEMVRAPSFVIIETEAEQDTLVRSFPLVKTNDAMNLVIIGALAYLVEGVIGLSTGIPGSFNVQGTAISGTLAEYQGDGEGAILGFTLAHEFGHYLGLWHPSQTDGSQEAIIGHDPIEDTPECETEDLGTTADLANCPDRENLMFPIVTNNTEPPITAQQIRVIELNPAVVGE